MQREENIVEKTIKQMEQQDASANLKDMQVNIAFVHRFIRKHAIAYHPYIDFWGLEERYQGYQGQQQGPQNTHMFNEPKDATFGSYYTCFLWQGIQVGTKPSYKSPSESLTLFRQMWSRCCNPTGEDMMYYIEDMLRAIKNVSKIVAIQNQQLEPFFDALNKAITTFRFNIDGQGPVRSVSDFEALCKQSSFSNLLSQTQHVRDRGNADTLVNGWTECAETLQKILGGFAGTDEKFVEKVKQRYDGKAYNKDGNHFGSPWIVTWDSPELKFSDARSITGKTFFYKLESIFALNTISEIDKHMPSAIGKRMFKDLCKIALVTGDGDDILLSDTALKLEEKKDQSKSGTAVLYRPQVMRHITQKYIKDPNQELPEVLAVALVKFGFETLGAGAARDVEAMQKVSQQISQEATEAQMREYRTKARRIPDESTATNSMMVPLIALALGAAILIGK
ncbi:MAG: hypothetical protein CMJ90_11715 [Planctomycetes bacterium]|nr:hypothetical protein [Planctomycetota bacterium]